MAKYFSHRVNNFAIPLIVVLFLSGCSIFGIRVGNSSVSEDTNTSTSKRALGGIFKSIDNGENFTHAVQGSDEKKAIDNVITRQLVFDEQDPTTLYLLTERRGLFVTYTSAAEWEQLVQEPLEAFALDPGARSVLYAAQDTRILKSQDGGGTWNIIFEETAGNTIVALAVDPKTSAHVLGLTRNGFIFESSDAGESWKLLKKLKVKTAHELQFNRRDPQEIYLVTTREGIFRTRNSGESWSLLQTLKEFKGSLDLGQFKLNPENPDILYHASAYGFLMSRDAGASFEALNLLTPKGSTPIVSIGFNPQDPNELFYATKTTLFQSTDGGDSWRLLNFPTTRQPIEILINKFNPDTLYIGVK